jgi:hypothetical protein
MTLKRCVLVAILAGVALVPAATASTGSRAPQIRLGLVPLQTPQLGPAGASLVLNYDSGPISSDGSVSSNYSGGVIILGNGGPTGLIGGHVLDYGDPFTGSAGVTEIRSSVEEFKTRADAKRDLALSRLQDRFLAVFLGSPFVHVKEKRVRPLRVGQRRFGYLVTEQAANLNPIARLDEQVAAGRFVLDLTVTAGSANAARKITPHLLRVLHRRLELRLEGHDHETRPPLPQEPHVGQAPGGPDLSTLILQPTDVGQSHAIGLFQDYTAAPPALSAFEMDLEPAGPYTDLYQQIGWWPTATEATYAETYGGGGGLLGLLGGGGSGSVVDLSGVGDNATGTLDTLDGGSFVEVTLTNGQAGETIFAESGRTLHASDVQSLAQAAANRLNAGLGP